MRAITQVKFLRQDAINDVFTFLNERGEEEFAYFPRSMEMNACDVESFFNESKIN